MKIKIINLIFAVLLLFVLSSCAKPSSDILKKDLDRYVNIEKELNIKIKLINDKIFNTIADYRNYKDVSKFNESTQLIYQDIQRLKELAKEVEKFIVTIDIKKYHTYTALLIKIQEEYIKETMDQFITKGEHGKNDAKLMQIKYERRMRKVQKKQTRILKDIAKEIKYIK